ncbi:MAG: hypothetical protein JNM72_19495 [Deltaproteobacteria bacterium]|nr:hypothetical protein [Deltaproteobacteria bacterium]
MQLRPLLLCVALSGCPKEAPPTPAPAAGLPAAGTALVVATLEPGPPPSPVIAASAATREEDSPGAPPIAGDPAGLDIERLARARMVFTLSTDQPVLGALQTVQPDDLLRSLTFDPRWRVRLAGGQALACRLPGRDETAGPGAYVGAPSPTGGAPTRLWRTCLRFGARPADHPWSTSPLVSHNSPEQRDLKVAAVQLDAAPFAGWQSAALTIDGPGLSVELHEVAPKLDMAQTAAALGDLQARLGSLDMALRRENPQRAALATLPGGEPKITVPTLICTKDATGALRIEGRVNPGAPAWVFARALDAAGRPITTLDAALGEATLARAGGSGEPNTAWAWGAQVPPAMSGGVAAVELWTAEVGPAPATRLHPGLSARCT